jgi:hypothetical protein
MLAYSTKRWVTGMDRYYDKVNKNEVLAFSGPPPTGPNIVILPPDNTFWGEPLEYNEEFTYDAQGLPLARVLVPPSDGMVMADLLRDAGLTQASLRQALLMDSRSDPAPLVAFNATLNGVIGSSPYTEAQFLEML